MGLDYIEVNLRLTVKHLATAKGKIQERLEGMVSLSKFTLIDFPEEMKPKWEKIWAALTASGTDEGNHIGAVRNTLRLMSDDEAEKIAEDIWDLWKETYSKLPAQYKTL